MSAAWLDGLRNETARRALAAMLLLGGIGAAGALCGCESQARQDPLLVRGSTEAVLFADTPFYADQTIARNIEASLDLADYVVLLKRADLLDTLRAPGPLTDFAVIDPAIETIPQIYRDRMQAPANRPGLKRLMAFTIVPGAFPPNVLRDMVVHGGGQTALKTLDGDLLTVRLDPTGRFLRLQDPSGRVSKLALVGVKQSNGYLYAGSTLLAPN